MARSGFSWTADGAIAAVSLPWSPLEEADLARAFIDLDLDGDDLHRWCKKNGINRSPGAIDARLRKMNFFIVDDVPSIKNQFVIRRDKEHKRAAVVLAAERNLANQVALARIEAATAPLFRPSKEETEKYLGIRK